MNFSIALEPMAKIARIGDENGYEAVGDAPHSEPTRPGCFTPAPAKPTRRERNAAALSRSITQVMTPRGPKPVLRTMMTTACERNCFYCPFRAGRSSAERLTLQPDEMADGFLRIQKAGLVDGLFLSSGIIGGGAKAQDKIIDTAEILRKKRNYPGFIHLKIMPGSEYEQVRRTMQLADRVSINLEGATQGRLARLAPQKEFWDDLMQRLMWMEQIRSRERVRASSVTQFVVGAVGDTDLELVSLSEKALPAGRPEPRLLFQLLPRARHPLRESSRPLPSNGSTASTRPASFCATTTGTPRTSASAPTKTFASTSTQSRPGPTCTCARAPVELNRADRPTLLRVPGIGPKSADRILRSRRQGRLTDLKQLRAFGVPSPQKAAPYVLLNGRQPSHQMALFPCLGSASNSHL